MKNLSYLGAPEIAKETAPTISYNMGSVGGVVTIANCLLAAIIIVALTRNEFSALTAIITGGICYGVTTLAALMILSGSLTAITTARQQQITLRHYHQLHYGVPRVDRVEPLHLADSLHVDPVQAVWPQTRTFVAPLNGEAALRKEALLWLANLYGADGLPDPKKVSMSPRQEERPGRVWAKWPSEEVKHFLIGKGILHDWGNALRLNVERCPTIEAVRHHVRA